MGLDMHLIGKRYIWEFDRDDVELIDKISSCFPEIGDNKARAVEVEFMYWRKANAIHHWFVENVQQGQDDCSEHQVLEQDLVTLRDVCQRVMDDSDNAEKYLPTQGGFFFGNTNYDEYYFDEVRRTLDWLNTVLFVNKFDTKLQRWTFYYQSSW